MTDSLTSKSKLSEELSAYARRDSWVWRDVALLLLRGSEEIERLERELAEAHEIIRQAAPCTRTLKTAP